MLGTEVLDGFRAYAILGVVLVHLLVVSQVLAGTDGGIPTLLTWGLLGNVIDAFFIVSGFVLFLPLLARGGSLGGTRRWALIRAARLLPAYWVCLLITLLAVLVIPPPGIGAPSASEVAVQFGTLQMPARLFDPSMPVAFGVNGPLWMISIIAGFYVVLALVARPYVRHPLIGLGLAALVTIAWKEAAIHTGVFEALSDGSVPDWVVTLIAIDQLPGWAFSFALGMTGAWGYRVALERWPRELLTRRMLQALPLIVVAYAGLAYAYGKTGQGLSGPVTGSLARLDTLATLGSSLSRAALMGAILLGPLALQRPFANRATRRLAELGYGIYLIHYLVIVYADRYLDLPDPAAPGSFLLLSAIVLAISLLYAVASRRWVEVPAREWAGRWPRRLHPPSPSQSPDAVHARAPRRRLLRSRPDADVGLERSPVRAGGVPERDGQPPADDALGDRAPAVPAARSD